MTTFEYLAGAYTLILSLAVVRLVAGIPHALRPGRLYWVHVSWLGLAVALSLGAFWLFLSYREFEFTLLRFVVVLATPVLVYMYSSLVAPSDPSSIESWRDYFYGVRVPLFTVGLLLSASVVFNNYVFFGISLFAPLLLPTEALLVAFAVGLSSGKPRLHAVLASCPPVVTVATLLQLSQPGAR